MMIEEMIRPEVREQLNDLYSVDRELREFIDDRLHEIRVLATRNHAFPTKQGRARILRQYRESLRHIQSLLDKRSK